LLSNKGIRGEYWYGTTYPSGNFVYAYNNTYMNLQWGTGHIFIAHGSRRDYDVWATFHAILIPAINGVHGIKMIYDDKVKLYFNGELKIDGWHGAGEQSFSVTLDSKQ
jgi:hypothetical protein